MNTDTMITRAGILNLIGYTNPGKLWYRCKKAGITFPTPDKVIHDNCFLYDKEMMIDWLQRHGFLHDYIDSTDAADLLGVGYNKFVEYAQRIPEFPRPVVKGIGRMKHLFNRDAIADYMSRHDFNAGVREARRRYQESRQQKPAESAAGDFNDMAQAFIRRTSLKVCEL